jgi:hypothetical protein
VTSYLNGGGLIAIPASVAPFREDPKQVKGCLIGAGVAFVIGLFCVALSQAFAFFTMARRSESERPLQFDEVKL